MLGRTRAKVLDSIRAEKKLLDARELEVLREVRERVFRNPSGFEPMREAEYDALTEEERGADNSRKRIDYILSQEVGYLLLSRKLPERLVAWFKQNKTWLFGSPLFGGVASAFTYYLEHKEEIDVVVRDILELTLKSADAPTYATPPTDWWSLTPREVLGSAGELSEISEYLRTVSSMGLDVQGREEIILWLEAEELPS